MKITCFFLAIFCSLTAFAHEVDFAINYYHLRTESTQTGQPSEFLFKPAPKIAIDYQYHIQKNQAVGLGVDYSMLEVDVSNISLFVEEDEYDPFNYYLKYSAWYKGGVNFTLLAGQKMFALYDIRTLGVTFNKFFPPFVGAGIAFRAKNILGAVELEYFYKYIFETREEEDTFTGYVQEIKAHLNIGRQSYSGQTRRGPFSKIFYTYYRTPAFEGNWGVYFKYIFSNIESERFAYKTDERSFGLYYKWRIKKRFRRN